MERWETATGLWLERKVKKKMGRRHKKKLKLFFCFLHRYSFDVVALYCATMYSLGGPTILWYGSLAKHIAQDHGDPFDFETTIEKIMGNPFGFGSRNELGSLGD
jgi:hypothetical protein